jgi:hypothetical protein
MTSEQLEQKILEVSPKMHQPAIMRNKSWLFVAKDCDGALHFYDNKFSPNEACKRITLAQPDYEILDIVAYTDADGANTTARALRDAQALFKYYNAEVRVTKPRTPMQACAASAALAS